MTTEIVPPTEAPAAPPVVPAAEPAPTPAPEPVAVTATTEVTPETAPEVIANLSPEARRAILFGGVPPAPAPKAEEVVPPVEAEVIPPVEQVPPVVPPVEPEKLLPNRINTSQFDDREQEAIALKHDLEKEGEKISLKEACERIEAKYGPRPAAEVTPPIPAPVVEPAHIVAARAELAALSQQIKDTARDELNRDEIEDLRMVYVEKLADLKSELKISKLKDELSADQLAQAVRTKQITARDASKEATLKEYPTANDDDSLLGAEITKQYLAIQSDTKHPDRARSGADDFPAYLTEKAAKAVSARLQKTLGYTEAQALEAVKGKPVTEAKGPVAPAVPAKTPVPPVPRTILVTAPGGKPAPEPVAMDAAQIIERANKDPKFRRAVLFGTGPSFAVT